LTLFSELHLFHFASLEEEKTTKNVINNAFSKHGKKGKLENY